MATKAQVEELEVQIRCLKAELMAKDGTIQALQAENKTLRNYNETLNKQLKRVKNAFVVASDALEDL